MVILTVWQPLMTRVEVSGGFTAFVPVAEDDVDEKERDAKVADELDAALIVCATRGRGVVRTALLGSTSHSVLQHAGRPVLIAPEPRSA